MTALQSQIGGLDNPLADEFSPGFFGEHSSTTAVHEDSRERMQAFCVLNDRTLS